MSVKEAREALWNAHLDPNVTPPVLELAAIRFTLAKQRSADRRDQWKLRRLSKSRSAQQKPVEDKDG